MTKLFIIAGIIVYVVMVVGSTMMCPQPFSYQLQIYGLAGLLSFPLLAFGISRHTPFVRRLGGRLPVIAAVFGVVLFSSVGLAFVTAGSEAECRALEQQLENLRKKTGGEQ